jgi:hypothetical protein
VAGISIVMHLSKIHRIKSNRARHCLSQPIDKFHTLQIFLFPWLFFIFTLYSRARKILRLHIFYLPNYYSLTKNCNHKRIGLYYLLSAFLFGLSGTIFSVLIRLELYSSGNRIISPENQNFYNISITLHGLLMIFFLVMPGLV